MAALSSLEKNRSVQADPFLQVDLLRGAGGDDFLAHAFVGRDAGEERLDHRAERRVALRAD